MKYSIGESVVHPAHGAGEIVKVEEQELVSGFKRYYVIEFLAKRLTMRVPIRKTDDLGIRAVMNGARLEQVFKTLRKLPTELPSNFKQRRQHVENLIRSGYPTKIAEAVRELSWRRKDAHLTKADSDLLSQGRELLSTEIALTLGCDVVEAQQRMDVAVAESIDGRLAQPPVTV